MEKQLFVDIFCAQKFYHDEKICGDTFLFRRIDAGDRSVIVLSDGMGHGLKANILSNLTASMIINFDYINDDIKYMAEQILKSLPVCSVRKMSYSTFSLIEVNMNTMMATIVEYDNPNCMVFRNETALDVVWDETKFENHQNNRQKIRSATIPVKEGDRIIVMSDGVTQSGLGSGKYPFGWGRKKVLSFIESFIDVYPDCSSNYLAKKVVERSVQNDEYKTKDDISCAVVTIRKSNNLLLCSCPPVNKEKTYEMVETIEKFNGKKVICGYHLATLISNITKAEIVKSEYSPDPDIQPLRYMDGVDFVTESLVTLNKVYYILQNEEKSIAAGVGAAYDVCRLILASDSVTILIGTSRENGGEYMVDEYELRRNVMRFIAQVIETKYIKEVRVIYS